MMGSAAPARRRPLVLIWLCGHRCLDADAEEAFLLSKVALEDRLAVTLDANVLELLGIELDERARLQRCDIAKQHRRACSDSDEIDFRPTDALCELATPVGI